MVTKRQLGILVAIAGLLIMFATIGADLVGAGRWSGFGPLQWIGIGTGLAGVAVGLILFRLGHRPA